MKYLLFVLRYTGLNHSNNTTDNINTKINSLSDALEKNLQFIYINDDPRGNRVMFSHLDKFTHTMHVYQFRAKPSLYDDIKEGMKIRLNVDNAFIHIFSNLQESGYIEIRIDKVVPDKLPIVSMFVSTKTTQYMYNLSLNNSNEFIVYEFDTNKTQFEPPIADRRF